MLQILYTTHRNFPNK